MGAIFGVKPDAKRTSTLSPEPLNIMEVKSKTALERELASRMLVGKRIQAFYPQMMQDAERAAGVALILGNGSFVAEASRQLIHEEIGAFIGAAEALKLISIPSETRELVLESMKQLAIRTAG